MRRPRLRADFEAVTLPRPASDGGDYLLLVAENRSLLIEDPVAAAVAPMLDGRHEVADLVAGLPHPPLAVATAVRRLRELDLLVDGPADGPRDQVAAYDARKVDPDRAHGFGRTGNILMLDGGDAMADAFGAALGPLVPAMTRANLAQAPQAMKEAPDAVVVAVVATMVDDRLAAINEQSLDTGRPWLLVRPHGTVAMAGPHFAPGQTGCWACLYQRWSENEQIERYLAARQPGRVTGPPRAALPAAAAMLAAVVAMELPVIAVRGTSAVLTGRMVALDTVDLTTTNHHLVRQPQCSACGDPDLTAPVRPDLTAVHQETAAATFARLEHHVSRYLGAVSRISRLDPEDNGVCYTYGAGHNFAAARHPAMLRDNLRGQSGGKGQTDVQAKMSALGEAIERYAAVWRGDRPEQSARYADLDPAVAVPIRDLTGFSDRQYAEREATNARYSRFHHVPQTAPDDLELDWTSAWSLTHGAPRLVPSVYCWYGHPQLALDVCVADSNGSAAGISLAAAIQQGFCELVERDSVALWWQHRSLMPGVDLDAYADPWLHSVRAYHRDVLGRDLWALDLTADLGVPTFAAVSHNVRRSTPDVLLGFGAHPMAATALTRAVSEVNQFLPAVSGVDAAGATRYGLTEPETVRWLRTVQPQDQPWLRPDPGAELSTPERHRPVPASVTDIAARAGLEVIVVDQTRPDIDLAVVKVVVPGLRHFWRRLGPGRLWEVPARLGRTPLAAGEESVNPLNVFF